jgi:hypothetical protein
MASLQVFASTIVCVKTAGTEPIAKAPEIKPAVKSVRKAIVGPPPVPKRCTERETHGRLKCCGLTGEISGAALRASLTSSSRTAPDGVSTSDDGKGPTSRGPRAGSGVRGPAFLWLQTKL